MTNKITALVSNKNTSHSRYLQHAFTKKAFSKTAFIPFFSVVLISFSGFTSGATFSVDSTLDYADSNVGDGTCAVTTGECTLRAAIQEANALIGQHTITLPAGTYSLNYGAVNEDLSAEGDLDISGNLIINGASEATTIIDGNANDNVFDIQTDGTLQLSKLTIQNALGTGINSAYTAKKLSLSNVTVKDNSKYGINIGSVEPTDITSSTISGNGDRGIYSANGHLNIFGSTVSSNLNGGILFIGANNDLYIIDSTISNNTTTDNGAGIYLNDSQSASLVNVIIDGNTAGMSGGGLYAVDTISIYDTQIINNTAVSGGGLWSYLNATLSNVIIDNNISSMFGGGAHLLGEFNFSNATITNNVASTGNGGGIFLNQYANYGVITNSTINGNSAERGGGLYATSSVLTLSNVTLSQNTSTDSSGTGGGNIYGAIRIENSIIDAAVSGGNCSTNLTSQGNNIDSDGSCGINSTADQSNVSPLLSPLANNGGFNKTHEPQATSPSIDVASNTNCPDLDQRNYYRGDAQCDIGAVEYGASQAQIGVVNFSAAAYSVGEADGSIAITVSRTGGSQGAVSVEYVISEGAAKITTSTTVKDVAVDAIRGTFSWADGDASDKTFTITIYDDSDNEADETIFLSLPTPSNSAIIGSVTRSTITIVDNDIAEPVSADDTTTTPPTDTSSTESTVTDNTQGTTTSSTEAAKTNSGAINPLFASLMLFFFGAARRRLYEK